MVAITKDSCNGIDYRSDHGGAEKQSGSVSAQSVLRDLVGGTG
jgi:hypothetical protein